MWGWRRKISLQNLCTLKVDGLIKNEFKNKACEEGFLSTLLSIDKKDQGRIQSKISGRLNISKEGASGEDINQLLKKCYGLIGK